MTLYYSLVFLLLMMEIIVFLVLIIPLPRRLRKSVFNFCASSPFIGKVQYSMKITFIFIIVLFIDSVSRVMKVTEEYNYARVSAHPESMRSEVQARKFYAQRNMYLCGFTLFLSLILNRHYVALSKLFTTQDRVDALTKRLEQSEATASKPSEQEKTLREKLDAVTNDYELLSEKYAKMQKATEPKKDI
ncbi:bcap family protein [Schizosaccharomyces japonicus yFS275]|uniref:Endoplasmic reticulum transmembrane protein n=1 Tax=Schizosaccharomyces japonicus (strain yFS275 / FY16936) TaxID=402676 RepID=B6K3Q3_SCHJY|nr:bcap family protein [Schizosaccharomyces japonicus yFS275]EEB08110.1 bcap family protein [Schizosaccharomyces japonicus yFS275]